MVSTCKHVPCPTLFVGIFLFEHVETHCRCGTLVQTEDSSHVKSPSVLL